jgi:hypothetical protein
MKSNSIKQAALTVLAADQGSDTPRGVIVASNDSRFQAGNPSVELTNFATGAYDKYDLLAELNIVAPAVPAPRRFSFRTAATAADFLTESDDVRAIGAAFKQVKATGGEENSKTLNKGLTVVLDKDELVPGDEERWIARLTQRLIRNDLVRAYAGLIAAATVTGKVWNTSADPDADVADMLNTGGDSRGMDSNVVVYGGGAWLGRFRALRGSDKAGGFAGAGATPEQLADLFQVDSVLVSKARKQTTATAKGKILGAYALAFYAEQMATRDDASNIKRFVTPSGSGPVQVWREEKAKTIELSVEHYSHVVVTSTLGITALSIT